MKPKFTKKLTSNNSFKNLFFSDSKYYKLKKKFKLTINLPFFFRYKELNMKSKKFRRGNMIFLSLNFLLLLTFTPSYVFGSKKNKNQEEVEEIDFSLHKNLKSTYYSSALILKLNKYLLNKNIINTEELIDQIRKDLLNRLKNEISINKKQILRHINIFNLIFSQYKADKAELLIYNSDLIELINKTIIKESLSNELYNETGYLEFLYNYITNYEKHYKIYRHTDIDKNDVDIKNKNEMLNNEAINQLKTIVNNDYKDILSSENSILVKISEEKLIEQKEKLKLSFINNSSQESLTNYFQCLLIFNSISEYHKSQSLKRINHIEELVNKYKNEINVNSDMVLKHHQEQFNLIEAKLIFNVKNFNINGKMVFLVKEILANSNHLNYKHSNNRTIKNNVTEILSDLNRLSLNSIFNKTLFTNKELFVELLVKQIETNAITNNILNKNKNEDWRILITYLTSLFDLIESQHFFYYKKTIKDFYLINYILWLLEYNVISNLLINFGDYNININEKEEFLSKFHHYFNQIIENNFNKDISNTLQNEKDDFKNEINLALKKFGKLINKESRIILDREKEDYKKKASIKSPNTILNNNKDEETDKYDLDCVKEIVRIRSLCTKKNPLDKKMISHLCSINEKILI